MGSAFRFGRCRLGGEDFVHFFRCVRIVLLFKEARRFEFEQRMKVAIEDISVHEAEIFKIRHVVEERNGWNFTAAVKPHCLQRWHGSYG